MKEGRPHSLHLTPMIAGLAAAAPFSWRMDGRYNARLDKASDVTGWRHHDLRRCWAAIAAEELGIAPYVIKATLAHAIGSQVSRTYNRAKHLAPMCDALLAYESWLRRVTHRDPCSTADRRCYILTAVTPPAPLRAMASTRSFRAMAEEYWCRKKVERQLQKSRSTIRRYVASGRLPRPVNPSGKPKGQRFWLALEIMAFEQQLRDERDANH
jgi:predicted DNA-binding transcriptional regulator AlpA